MNLTLTFIAFGVAFGYTLLRYYLWGEVVIDNLPSYLLNKALGFSSVLYFLLLLIFKWRKEEDRAKYFSKAMLHTAVIHSLISVALLSPLYYPRLFGWQKLNFAGELCCLFGVLAFYGLVFMRIKPEDSERKKNTYHVIMSLLVTTHVLALGYEIWNLPHQWFGELPPISMLSFFASLCACSLSLILFFKTEQNLKG